MSDCANVEVRELLPDLAVGALDAATRARVEEHLATCADCASELETLRLVRAGFSSTPAVDVARVVAALPKPVASAAVQRGAQPVRRWLDWRVAAALTTITVGGLSLAVSQRISSDSVVARRDSIQAQAPEQRAPESVPAMPPRAGAGTPRDTQSPNAPPPRRSTTRDQLSVGGGTGDIDDTSLRALLGALDEIDRAPIAPSAEPDRTPVLPVIKEGER